ncbi:hypothetical protein DC20_13975 [Rufibacter tibetensis]|uniref:Uncharacterized protein n=1 Tax=Rufibacter tibetensis TaxID=512763 RepID=A0A0P0C446_9BACT|nr:hypothetical protein DC20_13975 [Rufibacter tibetensis]
MNSLIPKRFFFQSLSDEKAKRAIPFSFVLAKAENKYLFSRAINKEEERTERTSIPSKNLDVLLAVLDDSKDNQLFKP